MNLPELSLDDATLREVVDDPDRLQERARELAEARDAAGLSELARTLRLLGQLDAAEDAARRALTAAGTGGSPHDVARARVALGEVLHWQGRFGEAEDEFAIAISEAEQIGDDRLRALALHERGRSRFTQGRVREAEQDFTAALQIRRRLGASCGEIAASEQAVTAAMRRLVSAAAHQ